MARSADPEYPYRCVAAEHPLPVKVYISGKLSVKEPLEPLMPSVANQAELWAVPDDPPSVPQVAPALTFNAIYETWFPEVSRWIRAMGGPEADREDLAQDVFLVVHRRLPDFDGQNLPGWLYSIARHRVRDFRRLLWVKNLWFGGVPLSDNLVKSGASPADSAETSERRALLERLLEKLNEAERATLVLFEIDGYSGEQIARLQGVPLNTVWARIHKARKKLKASLAKFESQSAARPAAAGDHKRVNQ